MNFKAKSPHDLAEIAGNLLESHKGIFLFAFFGKMGVGKTTFIKEICKKLQITDVVSSPTYSIINEYKSFDGKTVYHFDFYRISNDSEAFDLGFEDYLYSGNYCFIEWAEKVQNYLPDNIINVNICIENDQRIIKF